jgi:uncharacterized protein YndB with AHSA1/START domain
VLLELAEAGTGSDIFSTHLDPGGRITIHHMGYFSRGDEHRIGTTLYAPKLAAQGYDAPEWAAEVFSGLTIHVAIYGTQPAADGLSLEFLDFRLLGIPVDYPEKGAEALAELQVKVGPRVLKLPGPADGEGTAAWSMHADIDLPGTREEVWPWLVEPARLASWLGATVTLVSPGEGGDPGGIGAVRTVAGSIDGKDFSATQTITDSRHALILRWTAPDDGLFRSSEGVMTVTDDGAATELVWQVSFHPEHVLAGASLVRKGNAWMAERLAALAGLLGTASVARTGFSPPTAVTA